jgi:hypothetical protein
MFQKSLIIVFFLCAVVIVAGSPASAVSTVAINHLVEKSTEYDGQTVNVQGEAIGEVIERGEYAWVNLGDGGNAIGIWMTLENAEKIQYFGDYKNVGDTLLITGIFTRNCSQHGGDVDIHCDVLEILAPGHRVAETVSPVKILTAFILAVLAASAVIVTFIRRKKRTAA